MHPLDCMGLTRAERDYINQVQNNVSQTNGTLACTGESDGFWDSLTD